MEATFERYPAARPRVVFPGGVQATRRIVDWERDRHGQLLASTVHREHPIDAGSSRRSSNGLKRLCLLSVAASSRASVPCLVVVFVRQHPRVTGTARMRDCACLARCPDRRRRFTWNSGASIGQRSRHQLEPVAAKLTGAWGGEIAETRACDAGLGPGESGAPRRECGPCPILRTSCPRRVSGGYLREGPRRASLRAAHWRSPRGVQTTRRIVDWEQGRYVQLLASTVHRVKRQEELTPLRH